MLAASAAAQTCDISAATQLLEDNLGVYPGGVFVRVFQDDREIFTFQSGAVTAPRSCALRPPPDGSPRR